MAESESIAAGDQVVHPHHGPGTVDKLEEIDLGKGPIAYVVMTLQDGMTVKVPAAQIETVGIREPVTEARAEEVLAVLSLPAPEDPGHRVRRPRHSDLLASGRLIDCAEVVRDLTSIVVNHDRGGTDADIRMLNKAREQLAAELAVTLGISDEEAAVRMDEALAEGGHVPAEG